MKGYIKLHRQLVENELWLCDKFTRAQAWIDLLLLARHDSGVVTIRGIDIKLLPGQLCYSQLSLAIRWRWDRKTVKKFLTQLKKSKMVDIKISRITTIISVRNWNLYQALDNKTDIRIHNRFPTNNNDKNGKKELIELAFLLIESLQREKSVYSIINKYLPGLGEEKLLEILKAFASNGNRFKTEQSLAAYLEKCSRNNGRIIDSIPFAIEGQEGFI